MIVLVTSAWAGSAVGAWAVPAVGPAERPHGEAGP